MKMKRAMLISIATLLPTDFYKITIPYGENQNYITNDFLARDLIHFQNATREFLYPDNSTPVEYFKQTFTNWINSRISQESKIVNALMTEYAPLDNYDKKSTITESLKPLYENGNLIGGTSTNESGSTQKAITFGEHGITEGADTSNYTKNTVGTDGKTSAHYTASYEDNSGKIESYDVVNGGTESRTGDVITKSYHKEEITSYEKTTTDNTRGNIGVTTSMQMLQGELNGRMFDYEQNLFNRFLERYTFYAVLID